MTSLPSPSTENQCSDIVTDAANLSKNNDVSSEHVDDDEEEEEEDEEGDMDFNPLLKEALSIEASSSLSSEIEECEFDGDVVDSGEYHSPVVDLTNAPDKLHDDAVGNANHGQQMAMQAAEENERNIATNRVNDVTVAEERRDSDDEDAIWKRTRARYSLVGSTLDELETFLQETDDEDDLHHNIDDEEEYRKFLAAVLLDGDETSGAAPENENVDEESDNDADFELELEEALGSDGDDILPSGSQEGEHGRRPETRQKKRQKTDTRQNKFSGQMNRPLLPILPNAPIFPLLVPHARNYMNGGTSFAKNNHVSAFTPQQIGQLHCLMYEHVQLLVQVFSLSVLEPSKQHISTQVRTLLSEMLQKRDQVLASQRIPYPSSWFSLPYIYPAVTVQNNTESSTISGGVPPTESFFWVPSISDNVLSVMDVAPLSLVKSYMDNVSIAVQKHHLRQLEATYEGIAEKECLFPYKGLHPTAEASGVSSDPSTRKPGKARKDKSKKRVAAALAERSKQQSIALVPKPIASLALRFFPIFNPALFPHKPPPLSVANRVLFTDAEDGLLARGIMEHNTDWKEIQKKQKNLACSRAAENPVKAVRRMKNAPLTPQETSLIEEGLKLFKMDWMAIGKWMVPHRDPSLLSRQYRTAVGNQKSYKGDELMREKRRLYESQRRKSKALNSTAAGQNREGLSTVEDANLFAGFPRRRTVSDKENCSADNAGGENNSGDDGGNNEDEAYVHEAFLADWRPAQPNLGENQPVELFTQNRSINPNTSSHPVPAKIFRPSDIHPRRLVQLAPDLPPVNLPPTVRIMSQSAFTKYQDGASSKVRDNVVPTRTGQSDERNSLRCSTSDAGEKGDSDLQMHPLLFQDPEDGNSLPYYPLHGSAGSSSSFDFFSSNSPQLNLNLPRYSHQDKNTFAFFNNSLRSKELTSSSTGVDFHPLLQRVDDGIIPHPPADSSTPHRTDVSAVPRSPIELDLDISLSYTARKEKGRSGRESRTTETQPSRPQGLLEENGNDHDSGDRSVGIRNDEIVMEQEELSDSEDEDVEEGVEFECEEMTDSEGEGGSDSDHAENVQNEDVQDDSLPKDMVRGDDSDQDEPRVRETSTSNMANDKDEPFSLFGLNLNAKPPVTRKPRNSHANRSSKNTTLSQPQSGTATQTKKPRKRAQN
ncbi:Myb-like protein [Tanacetum coccineum]